MRPGVWLESDGDGFITPDGRTGGYSRISNIGIKGSGTGTAFRFGAGFTDLNNVWTPGFGVGLSSTQGANTRVVDSRLYGDVAGIAYEEGSPVKVVNTLANQVLNLTEGTFGGPKYRLNLIAHELLGASTPLLRLNYTNQMLNIMNQHADVLRFTIQNFSTLYNLTSWAVNQLEKIVH